LTHPHHTLPQCEWAETSKTAALDSKPAAQATDKAPHPPATAAATSKTEAQASKAHPQPNNEDNNKNNAEWKKWNIDVVCKRKKLGIDNNSEKKESIGKECRGSRIWEGGRKLWWDEMEVVEVEGGDRDLHQGLVEMFRMEVRGFKEMVRWDNLGEDGGDGVMLLGVVRDVL
jgi:hypothetical protein